MIFFLLQVLLIFSCNFYFLACFLSVKLFSVLDVQMDFMIWKSCVLIQMYQIYLICVWSSWTIHFICALFFFIFTWNISLMFPSVVWMSLFFLLLLYYIFIFISGSIFYVFWTLTHIFFIIFILLAVWLFYVQFNILVSVGMNESAAGCVFYYIALFL